MKSEKQVTTIWITKSTFQRAKKLGINISRICDIAIKQAVARMEGCFNEKAL